MSLQSGIRIEREDVYAQIRNKPVSDYVLRIMINFKINLWLTAPKGAIRVN